MVINRLNHQLETCRVLYLTGKRLEERRAAYVMTPEGEGGGKEKESQGGWDGT